MTKSNPYQTSVSRGNGTIDEKGGGCLIIVFPDVSPGSLNHSSFFVI